MKPEHRFQICRLLSVPDVTIGTFMTFLVIRAVYRISGNTVYVTVFSYDYQSEKNDSQEKWCVLLVLTDIGHVIGEFIEN